MAREKTVKFSSVLTKSTGEYGGLYFPVSREVAEKFEVRNGTRRVVCTANGKLTFQCAVLPNKLGFYIGTNKRIRDTLGLKPGDKVTLQLKKDETRYGCPMPEEFQEVLHQDPDGDRVFHSLTPGMQRSMLYSISRQKDIDKRIHYSLVILKHLKDHDGKLIYDLLHEELKRPAF